MKLNCQELEKNSNPVAFFVSGFGGRADCISPNLRKRLQLQGISVYDHAWNDIYGRRSSVYLRLSSSIFITQMVNEVIPKIKPNRPIILIGHSLGSDVLLKVAHQLKTRKIDFLAMLDGVQTNGRRTTNSVPENISYFYNRWTINPSFPGYLSAVQIPGIAYKIGVPLNAYESGYLFCDRNSTYSDQNEQSYSYTDDEKPILLRTSIKFLTKFNANFLEVENIKYQPTTHAYKNAIHKNLYIQKQMFEIVMQLVKNKKNVYSQYGNQCSFSCSLSSSEKSHLMI